MDAWVLHWTEYSMKEMHIQMAEDFEENETYQVRDLVSLHGLKNRRIENIEMDYLQEDDALTAELRIQLEGNVKLLLQDFGDPKDQKLTLTKTNNT